MNSRFDSENEMSFYFKEFIKKTLHKKDILILDEVKGLFGIPDYLFIEQHQNEIHSIVAIELKLRNWQRALIQAFKYKTFSNQAIVVMDENFISSAVQNIEKFIHYDIGLASFNRQKDLKIFHFPSNDKKPFSKNYVNKLISKINFKNVKSCQKINNRLSDYLYNFCIDN